MNKAVFLDRDGTINIEKNYLHSISEFEFVPGAIESLKLLQNVGFKLIIITNQSGIARGFYKEQSFLELNEWMLTELAKKGVNICKVYYCPHHPEAKILSYRVDCDCRKPRLGLYEKAIGEFKLNLVDCYAIGDKIRDCAICLESECRGFLVGNNENQEIIDSIKNGKYKNINYANSLYDAALIIAEEKK